MGNWIPNDPTLVAQILKISSAYSPPPPEGFISPMTWGIESNVIERFQAQAFQERTSHSSGRHIRSISRLARRVCGCIPEVLTGRP